MPEQPASPASPLSSRQSFCAQEVPTASQGLLKLFQKNSPMEDLGAKGVSPERWHSSLCPERSPQEESWIQSWACAFLRALG